MTWRLPEVVEDAEALLQSLEKAAALIGLYCNESKTEYINTTETTDTQTTESSHNLKSLSGEKSTRFQIFKVRKSFVRAACNKLQKLWHSNLSRDYKVFQYLAEPILLDGAETWTLADTDNPKKTGRNINEPSSPGAEHSLGRACNKGEYLRKPALYFR